ncbi:MAG: DUF4279 domain-containing protein [Oscillospiraceae bacterium]|nr:DUF4279 domain-containing protein [Oscillospiraceae bacterium]
MEEGEKIEIFIPIISVSFCLNNIDKKDFNIDEVTNRIGIVPTKTRRKNEFPQSSIEAGIAMTEWVLTIREEKCQDISIPFIKIINSLKDKKDIIKTLCNDLELTPYFTVIIHLKTGNRPLNGIPNDIISFISSINAGIGFDLYCYDKNNDFEIERLSNFK